MATYSKILSVSVTTYNTAPDVEIPFVPKVIRVCNMDGVDTVNVSFDGTTDAGVLLNDVKSPSSVQQWTWQLATKLWLKTHSAPVAVQVIAEA